MIGPVGRVGDEVLGSGPELRGSTKGNVGAQEAGDWPDAGADLVQRLNGGLTDYFIDNIPGDNTRVGLYRMRQTEERTEPGAGRMSQSSSPSSRTGDKTLRMLVIRDVSQQRRLREMAKAQREFWASPKTNGGRNGGN